MNELRQRRLLLLAQADRERAALGAEIRRLGERQRAVRAFMTRHKWGLVGGALFAGALVIRNRRTLVRWLPVLSAGCGFLLR